ncbi:MAG: metal-dependent transcriptional regulator [candidate division Zixibacteria bacterium]|nr:metal-dependent transcriptional regulator [candidate division Zixibacteria bacterium]MDD5425633.1 metal-dependent transcriptional regulator [candidate division Zixibacteria bacterium]
MPTSEMLSASLEDYLEAIFHLVSDKQAARSKDISRLLKVNVSSVTGALQVLAQKNLVNYSPYEVVTLTEKGEQAARDVVRRHRALRDFFVKVLAVEEGIADKGACRIEHTIPREILERFVEFVDFIEKSPVPGANCVHEFKKYCGHEKKTSHNSRTSVKRKPGLRKQKEKTRDNNSK